LHVSENLRQTLEKDKPENLEIVGRVTDAELLKYMQKSNVYVQVSAHEGFGCSMAEAMLCECIPVVTGRGAIPEVVGDCGYFVPFNDPPATAEAIKKALDDKENGNLARERIATKFPLSRREEAIISLISGVVE